MKPADLWQRYRVRWDFLGKLCGQVPSDPDLVSKWLDSRKPKVRPPESRSLTETAEEVFATLPEEESEFVELIFQRHPQTKGLCMRAATIKAHLKDCARIISTLHTGKIEGEKSFATKIVNGVYPDPSVYWVPLERPSGEPILEPDGRLDRAVHAMGRRGMQNSLKRFEWVEPSTMRFSLFVMKARSGKPCVSLEDLETLMLYGGTHGYAGERSAGEGRYAFTLEQEADK